MSGHLKAGAVLGRRQVRRAQPVARWALARRSGESIEVLAAVITDHGQGRLVVAERTPAGRWATTHVLAPTREAVGMLRRQHEGAR